MGIKKLQSREFFPRYTIREWEQWEGQWELIDGFAWAMSPAPNRKHQALNYDLLKAIKEGLEKCTRCEALLPINLKINEETVLQPDITVVCDAPKDFTLLEKTPVLVVEILSPSTATKDLHVKAAHYAAKGVRYYLIVHPEEEWVRIMGLEDDEYQTLSEQRDGQFTFDLDECKVAIDFGQIWV
jgi:Uma2 family endonuclease